MNRLEHKVYGEIKSLGLESKKALVCVSGGKDSMALLTLMATIARALKVRLGVAIVHHGESSHKGSFEFRQKSVEVVKGEASKLSLDFFTNPPESWPKTELQSEDDFRTYRFSCLNRWLQEWGGDFLLLGHHREDFLETQMMKMLRGCGLEALQNFKMFESSKLRPLLNVSSQEIDDYVLEKDVVFLDDPTNKQTVFFRNWLRNEWFAQLESRKEGALGALCQSFMNLQQDIEVEVESCIDFEKGIDLLAFFALPLSQRKQALAQYMKLKELNSASMNHIKEVLKRLDTNKKEHTFRLLRRVWRVSPVRLICEDDVEEL